MFAPRKRRALCPSILRLETLAAASSIVPGTLLANGSAGATPPPAQVSAPSASANATSWPILSSPVIRTRINPEPRPAFASRPRIEPTVAPTSAVSATATTFIDARPSPNAITITPPIVARFQGGAPAQPTMHGGAGVIRPMTMTSGPAAQSQPPISQTIVVQQPVETSGSSAGGANGGLGVEKSGVFDASVAPGAGGKSGGGVGGTSGGGGIRVGTGDINAITGGYVKSGDGIANGKATVNGMNANDVGGVGGTGFSFTDSNNVAYNTEVSADPIYACAEEYEYGVGDAVVDFKLISYTGFNHGSILIVPPGGQEPYGSQNVDGYDKLYYKPNIGFFGKDSMDSVVEDIGPGGRGMINVHFDYTVLPPPIQVNLGNDGNPTADDSTATFVASPASGDPHVTLDQAVIQWRFTLPDGSVKFALSPSAGGDVFDIPTLSGHAGDVYKVYAKITQAAVDGGPLLPVDGVEESNTVVVQPGVANNLSFEVDRTQLPADGMSQSRIKLTARDAAGNLVADGTPVSWRLTGSGTFINQDSTTTGGVAYASVQAGIFSETMSLSAAVDAAVASTDIENLPVTIQIGITGQVLTLGSNETQDVLAIVNDASGRPVADFTPITWYTQKGSISGQSYVKGGVATAKLFGAAGTQSPVLGSVNGTVGAQTPGNGLVRATVGSHSDGVTFLWVSPNSGISVTADQHMLAGDQTTAGSYPVDQADGTVASYGYMTTANCSVAGPAGATVLVTIGKDRDGNLVTQGAGLLTIGTGSGSSGQTTTITLDANGRGSFQISSTGGLDPSQKIKIPITVETQPGWFDGPPVKTTFEVGLQSAEVIAKATDIITQLGWGALAGDGNTAAEIAGDIGLSLIPVVGVYTDVRDLGKELAKLWPGGESPNWFTVVFSVVSVAGSFMGPEVDWLPTLGKQAARVFDASKGLWKSVMVLTKAGDFSKLNDLRSLLFKLIDPANAPLKKLAEDVLVENADDLGKLANLVDGFDTDTVVTLFNKFTDNPDGARRLFDNLSGVKPDSFAALKQDPYKLAVVAQNQAGVGTQAAWSAADIDKLIAVGIARPSGTVPRSLVDAALNSGNAGTILEGKVANHLYGQLTAFQWKWIGPNNLPIGETDVEVAQAIISCTVGKGNKVDQITKEITNLVINPTGKKVILYAPNMKFNAISSITQAGGVVARSLEELDALLIKFGG